MGGGVAGNATLRAPQGVTSAVYSQGNRVETLTASELSYKLKYVPNEKVTN